MRTATFSVALGAVLALLLPTGRAVADPAWLAPYVSTTIPNGMGPGPAPRGTVSADFTGDGRADIVTIGNFTQGNLLLAPGNGDGTFGPTSEIPNTSQTQGIDTGDLNGDGLPDIVAMSTSQVRIEYGDGHGGFIAGGTYPMTLGGQVEPRVVDVNDDGRPDIVAPTFTSIQTLLNQGNGSFVAGPTTQINGSSALSAISPANLNRDRTPDLLAVDGSSGSAYALIGTGTGAFTVAGTFHASGFVPEDVAAIDLNGDGCDDLAMIDSFSFTVDTALTNCRGGFTSSIANHYQYSGSGPTSLTAADLNRDGRSDLVVSSLANSTGNLLVLAGNGTAAMHAVGNYAVPFGPQNPVIADYDGDGKLDVAVASPGALSFLRNLT
jgi:hypothetical protein